MIFFKKKLMTMLEFWNNYIFTSIIFGKIELITFQNKTRNEKWNRRRDTLMFPVLFFIYKLY